MTKSPEEMKRLAAELSRRRGQTATGKPRDLLALGDDASKPGEGAPAPAREQPQKQKHYRERVLVSAEDWRKRLAALERMTVKEREEFERNKRLELSITDIRDDAISLIRNHVGTHSGAFEIVHGRGGPTPATLQAWANNEVFSPQARSLRAVAIALDLDFGFFERRKK